MRILPTKTSSRPVDLGGERVDALRRIVEDDHAGRRREQLAALVGAEIGSRVCTLTDSEWALKTGTRAQVAEIPSSSEAPRILRVSAIILRSSVV